MVSTLKILWTFGSWDEYPPVSSAPWLARIPAVRWFPSSKHYKPPFPEMLLYVSMVFLWIFPWKSVQQLHLWWISHIFPTFPMDFPSNRDAIGGRCSPPRHGESDHRGWCSTRAGTSDVRGAIDYGLYPLVNVYISMENHYFLWVNYI